MNGLIRFGHEVSLLDFFVTRWYVGKKVLAAAGKDFRAIIDGASEEDQKLCKAYVARANRRTFLHLLCSPMALVTIVAPTVFLVAMVIGFDLIATAIRGLRNVFSDLDGYAFEGGRAQQRGSMPAESGSFC
jgi:hypothetical protein